MDLGTTKKLMLQLGLSSTQIELYLHLNSHGQLTITNLSKQSGIPKTTVYRAITTLRKYSLVSTITNNTQRLLRAENPDNLYTIIDRMKLHHKNSERRLNSISSSLPMAVSTIKTLLTTNKLTRSSIQYFKGTYGFKAICNKTLALQNKELLQITNYKDWKNIFTPQYAKKHYTPTRIKNNITIRSLVLNNVAGRALHKQKTANKIKMKLFSNSTQFKGTIFIYGNEVSITLSSKPYTGVLIKDQNITSIAKNLFNTAWEMC